MLSLRDEHGRPNLRVAGPLLVAAGLVLFLTDHWTDPRFKYYIMGSIPKDVLGLIGAAIGVIAFALSFVPRR